MIEFFMQFIIHLLRRRLVAPTLTVQCYRRRRLQAVKDRLPHRWYCELLSALRCARLSGNECSIYIWLPRRLPHGLAAHSFCLLRSAASSCFAYFIRFCYFYFSYFILLIFYFILFSHPFVLTTVGGRITSVSCARWYKFNLAPMRPHLMSPLWWRFPPSQPCLTTTYFSLCFCYFYLSTKHCNVFSFKYSTYAAASSSYLLSSTVLYTCHRHFGAVNEWHLSISSIVIYIYLYILLSPFKHSFIHSL